MALRHQRPSWIDRIGNIAQMGGIETSVLDNGSAKGTRIAWLNTGSGLRYKVVIDRCLDIADAFYNQHSLVWLSHSGVTAPRPDANRDFVWLESFAGGLVTTCGLTHIGSPEKDEFQQRGLHGRISNIPAQIESIVQPSPGRGNAEMSITARMVESSVFGPSLELRRTISSPLGESIIKIHDQVTNIGNDKAPHMILYHCNFGFPLVDKNTEIIYKGSCTSRGLPGDNEIFSSKHNYKKCPAPMESHRGAGEAGAFVNPQAGKKGLCIAGLYNAKLQLAVSLTFRKKQLPCLSNWQHWGKREYVTGLEPGTHFPVGQETARKEKKLIYLLPGESRTYDLQIEVFSGKNDTQKFLRAAR